MDTDDSRDASSGNESDRNNGAPQSPSSRHSPISRSPSPDDSGPQSPPDSPGSARSRSSSPGDGPQSPPSSRSRSRSRPKSPDSVSYHSSPAQPRSPPENGARSPGGSSRSSSPEGPKSPTAKSASSRSSKSLDRLSGTSSRGYRKKSEHDGNSTDSSAASVDSSSRKNKTIIKNVDTQPEEISDGDMDSDNDKDSVHDKKEDKKSPKRDINISHEDLSDVSDLEESIGGHTDDEKNGEIDIGDSAQKQDDGEKKIDKPRTEDGEEQLDFEAEDGECEELPKDKDDKAESLVEEGEAVDQKDKERDELEEGEVTDEDDARPEETEPRPVCRFFSRGQCTWGASCRFLHPGVTDKGNYTMFELIRPVVPGEYGREERSYTRPEPAPIESAWERGLRTAKEMLRKSIKRKEQDIDFEEKKMNLSLAQDEFDKENGYYGRVPTPEPRYVRHVPVDYQPIVRAAPPPPPPPPEEYYGRRQVIYEPDYVAPTRERVRSYRELPSHRMPDYYNNKYEDEPATSAKTRKPKREVIVQRAEERPVRGDEWSDPWMRSKSPAGRKSGSGRKRSYSSGSSYSSSSSSHSSSESSRSSFRSRSRSHNKRRSRHRSRHVSPSVIVSERKAANERAALMNPPAPRKRAPSPGMMRVSAANPPAPSKEDQFGRTRSKLAVAAALARVNKGRRRSSKSSSDSSGSSSSDTDSSGSSSSSSRDGSSTPRRSGAEIVAKAMDALKSGSAEKRQIKLNLKNPVRKTEISDLARKAEALQGKKRPAASPPPLDPKSKKATSRREELLKQLKAVEDAIAKKRSKVN